MSDREDRSSSERRGKSSSAKDRSRSRSKSRRSASRSPRSRSPRSRSPRSRSYSKSRSRSRSRSPSYSRRRRYSRSRSRSPRFRRRSPRGPPRRRRHYGSREDPPKSNCLGIFGLSLYTTESELKEFLEKFGTLESCQLVFDHQSGRSRGFAFAYFPDEDEAEKVKEATSGREVDGRRIRVDYSITQRAHTPTPGVYMGKPSQFRNRKDNDKHYGRDRDDGYSQRRDYSRSRSRSPRRR